MPGLMDTVMRYDAIKRERIPRAAREADVEGASSRRESGETERMLSVLWVDVDVAVDELREAAGFAVGSAMADLARAGLLTVENVALVQMVAETMWLDGLAIGVRHDP